MGKWLGGVLVSVALCGVLSDDPAIWVTYHDWDGTYRCEAVPTPGSPLSENLMDLECPGVVWDYYFYRVPYGEDVGHWEF